MKLFIKILLFVLVALVVNVNITSAAITFPYIQEATTYPSPSFHIEITKKVQKAIENDLVNCCQNRNDLVDCRNRVVSVEAVAAKGGTTVLGHYPQYVKVAETIGARTFQIPTKIWNKMTPAQQWGANQKFLDRMILRGDNIRLATPLIKLSQAAFIKRN
ncbi:hypothetical protein JHJ32_21095 [Parapedobacter sp. ISTM3]|uniref:hypothetical protein n=1 Tax=Parapedobacter sp. ISTM3 TaxID=2800130 RepID=UPI001903DFD0|nr:hypothetical protein [Parapedobacter sp. ISTM3]MBK1442509.1 hypothetical protein [Parapedobacter sp. ISTM3]